MQRRCASVRTLGYLGVTPPLYYKRFLFFRLLFKIKQPKILNLSTGMGDLSCGGGNRTNIRHNKIAIRTLRRFLQNKGIGTAWRGEFFFFLGGGIPLKLVLQECHLQRALHQAQDLWGFLLKGTRMEISCTFAKRYKKRLISHKLLLTQAERQKQRGGRGRKGIFYTHFSVIF